MNNSIELSNLTKTFIAKKIANIKNIAKVQSSFVMTEVKSGGLGLSNF